MSTGKILVVDDSKSVLNALRILLASEFEKVDLISNQNILLQELNEKDHDVVLLDMNFRSGESSGNEGLFWLREIKKKHPFTEVVMLTAYGDVELAVKALKEGAIDFILKPWDNEKLLATLKAALRLRLSTVELSVSRKKEQALNTGYLTGETFIPGSSIQMRNILELLQKVSRTEANVLITGENGTGKELIAREIHKLSRREKEIMLTVDLGSIHDNLFESELFGHRKGSFTDAHEDRTGKFVLANKGTLFLDEIGNLPLHLQAKLLSVIQKRVVTPVGSNKEYPIDIRLICATNRNLAAMVKENLFREDLLYRINTIQLEVPPLRERKKGRPGIPGSLFPFTVWKKIWKAGIANERSVPKQATNAPMAGKCGELQHAIEKAVILCDGDIVGPESFPFSSIEDRLEEGETLEAMERKMIIRALDKNKGNLSNTANQLGITRQTLYNKLKKYGL